jgi:hypothetical protein
LKFDLKTGEKMNTWKEDIKKIRLNIKEKIKTSIERLIEDTIML